MGGICCCLLTYPFLSYLYMSFVVFVISYVCPQLGEKQKLYIDVG